MILQNRTKSKQTRTVGHVDRRLECLQLFGIFLPGYCLKYICAFQQSTLQEKEQKKAPIKVPED